jgi:hypothetical protein
VPVANIVEEPKIINIENNIYYFFEFEWLKNKKGFMFECEFSYTSSTLIEGFMFETTFQILDFNINNNLYSLGEFYYNTPIDVEGDTFYLCKYRYDKIKKGLGYLMAKYPNTISINKGLSNVGGHLDKWSTVWAQIFIPTAADVSNIQVLVYDLTPSEEIWTIEMPIDYIYVDEILPAEDKPRPKKGKLNMPHIALMPEEAYPKEILKKKPKDEKLCQAIYKNLDYSGFEYNIESDDKLLIGNYVYKIKKDMYGGELIETTSMFVKNRYASDLDVFKNKMIDMLESQVKKPVDDDYSIDKFKLAPSDFGNNISQEAFKQIENQMDNLKEANEKSKEVDNMSINEYMKSHPDQAKEMKKYLDDLNSPMDAYVWENNPARKPIDGVLFKKVKISQKLEIKPRTDDV